MWLIYNLLFPFIFLLLSPFYFWKMVRRGNWRMGFGQRFSCYDAAFRAQVAGGVDVWIQAVSVGEVGLALALIKKWREQSPHLRVALTTTTSTGQQEAHKQAPENVPVAYFPVDWPLFTRRALKLFQPRMLVIVETEIWPNVIRLAKKKRSIVALINGRVSEKSFRSYRRLRSLSRSIFELLDLVLTQSEAEAERFVALGAKKEAVHALGQLKFDLGTNPPHEDDTARAILKRCGVQDAQRVWVCGSTFAGEEDICLRIAKKLREKPFDSAQGKFPDLFMVLVPRHAERAAEVIALARRMNVKLAVRSEMSESKRESTSMSKSKSKSIGDDCECLLVDTTGELRGFYETATVVFVGKSLTAIGGQNPIEAAAAGKPIIVGPHMENFREVMEGFRHARAIVEVNDEAQLTTEMERLLSDDAARELLGQRAQQVVLANRGALARTVNELTRVLESKLSEQPYSTSSSEAPKRR